MSQPDGLRRIRSIEDFELEEKNVFLRVDFNVPMKDGEITDDKRIRAALPTIQYAIDHGAKLVLASHLGRPKGQVDANYSLEPVAKHLGALLDKEVILIEEPASDAAKGLLFGLQPNQVLLLENLRFDPGETKNSDELSLGWAEYVDIYINDAFGASHRAHASIVGLPSKLENRGIGYLVQSEIRVLDQMLGASEKPFFMILGGAKVSDKIGVIESMVDVVDGIAIGGAMAYTFLRASGLSVGDSLVEKDSLQYASELIERMKTREKKLLLPIDHVVAESFDANECRLTESAAIDAGWMGLDIGPKTRELYSSELSSAKTVFWNGPMGVFERPDYAAGTFALAETLSGLDALTVVGGGDSAAAAKASGHAEKMSHISTGGGASLEYLQGDSLPGLEILREKVQ